jgi:hypothetical protein
MRSQKHLLIVVLLLSTSALADEPVQFGSAELKSLVQKQLGVRDPTPTDMPAPEELQGSPGSVASLAGLEYSPSPPAGLPTWDPCRIWPNYRHWSYPASGLLIFPR